MFQLCLELLAERVTVMWAWSI